MKSLTVLIIACLIGFQPTQSQAQKPELVVQAGEFSNHIAFSRDSALMAQCNGLWDMQTRRLLRVFPVHGMAFGSDFSPDGLTLAVCDLHGVTLWDIDSGQHRPPLQEHKGVFTSVAYSPDGACLAGDCDDGSLYLWETRTGKLEAILPARLGGSSALAFSPDSHFIVTGGSSGGKGCANIWSMRTATLVRTMTTGYGAVFSVAVSPDGHTIVGGSNQGASLWETATGKALRSYPGCRRLAFSPDGRRLVSVRLTSAQDMAGKSAEEALQVSLGDTIECLDTQTERTLWKRSESYGMMGVTVSPDSAMVMVSTFGPVACFDMNDGHDLGDLTLPLPPAASVIFRQNDPALKTSKHVWDLRTAQEEALQEAQNPKERLLEAFPKPRQQGNEMAFYTLAAASGDGERLARVETHQPLGKDAGVGSDEITLWDVARQTELSHFGKRPQVGNSGDAIAIIRFSPNHRYLAAATFNGMNATTFTTPEHFHGEIVRCWDTETGQLMPSLRAPTGHVDCMEFSSDNNRLVGGYNDGTVDVWDVRSGNLIHSVQAHTDSVNSLVFSPDGSQLWTGGDSRIRLWDAATLTSLADINGSEAIVGSLALSPDGSLLANMDGLGGFQLWSLPARKKVEMGVVLDDDNYFLITPEGYYLTTRDAYKGIAFRIGRHAFPFEQFDLRLNRPDKVLAALGCPDQSLIHAYKAAYLKRLEKMGFTEAQVADGGFHLPDLHLTGPVPPLTTAERTLQFAVAATDALFPLDRVQVFVNDVPANFTFDGKAGAGSGGFSLRALSEKQAVGTISVELSAGSNKVQVSALNSQGVESLRQTFNVICTAPASLPDLFVIAVGVSEYGTQSGLPQLHSADADAQAVAAFFTAQVSAYAHPPHVLSLLNGHATRENILAARQLLMQSQVDDEVVVFLAGHGLLDAKKDYYFGTPDITVADPPAHGLGYDQIEGLLDGIPARHKLLLMDTCHAGEVDKPDSPPTPNSGGAGLGKATSSPIPPELGARGRKPNVPLAGAGYGGRGTELVETSQGLDNAFELQGELFADLRRGSGATVIAAARGVETAGETTAHGLFTQSVLDALQANPQIKVSALRDSVAARIDKETAGRQRPTARRENLEDDFAIVPAP